VPSASEKKEDHVPTIALWALASIGRAYPERMIHICQRGDEEECALFAEQADGYYVALHLALHVALYTRRPGAFYARRPFIRRASARLEEVLDEEGGGDSVRCARMAAPPLLMIIMRISDTRVLVIKVMCVYVKSILMLTRRTPRAKRALCAVYAA
jgi:hypothetical protein